MKAATLYAGKLGWAVVPIRAGDKRPAIDDWSNLATSDADQVAAWISRFPKGNIGIATGTPSGFWALDVDVRSQGDATLAALLEQHGPLPHTAQAKTGSGGSHYLFKVIEGLDLRNSAGKLGRGLDTRGTGGQIVVAPSVSASGPYRWVNSPFDTPIADAPTWLVGMLSTSRSSELATGQSTERGYFPPASDAVLKDAAAYLEQHGPAIQGNGGDAHTFIACAGLIHDFALTEDEAWPLLTDWNDTCSPPWSDDALAAKMRSGQKSGSAAYGSKRSADTYERVDKLITDWQTSDGRSPSAMVAMVKRARAVISTCEDRSGHATIARNLVEATGLKLRDLDLPETRASVVLKPGETLVTVDLAVLADVCTAAIAPSVFERGGVLCQVIATEQPYIYDLESSNVQDLMSRVGKFVRAEDNGATVRVAAPLPIAIIVAGRRQHVGLRTIESITKAPIFLADGSILQERGYNATARVYLEPSVTVAVADWPEHADAVSAVDLFRDLLCDFDFASAGDFSTWLAGLLSPLVKTATSNAPAPLICLSASNPGSGKTLLIDLLSRIITGEGAEVRPYNAKDPGEWGKRLTAFVKAASPVSVFDNVNGSIGDEGLDRLVTSSRWSDRILGASEAPPLPNVTTWFATGNHIEPVGDTVRRSLVCKIEVKTERPQERAGFRYDPIEGHVIKNRSILLSAALTILRAYHCAGRPSMGLPSWGSFTEWSALVRNALVWAGCADPFLTQQRAAAELNEPENDVHDFWIGVIDASGAGSPASIAARANALNASEVLSTRDQMTPHTLRRFLNRFVDKPRLGKRIRRAQDPARYFVEII